MRGILNSLAKIERLHIDVRWEGPHTTRFLRPGVADRWVLRPRDEEHAGFRV